jgi:predicted DNA-binding protein YlxM (UPF0122 family)
MAVSGKPFEPDYINDVILKFQGNINFIAKHYKVSRSCIYDYINSHPELSEVIEKARNRYEHDQLDAAEYIMELGLKMYDSDYKKAFEAAKYVLDKKGHKRGWGTDGKPQHEKAVDNQLGMLIGQSEEIYRKMKEAQK